MTGPAETCPIPALGRVAGEAPADSWRAPLPPLKVSAPGAVAAAGIAATLLPIYAVADTLSVFRRASGLIPPPPSDGPYTDEWPPANRRPDASASVGASGSATTLDAEPRAAPAGGAMPATISSGGIR